DYPLVETALTNGGTTLPERRTLAAKAFARTAAYEPPTPPWMPPPPGPGPPGAPQAPRDPQAPRFPDQLTVGGRLRQTLRYGENPHQGAAFYAVEGPAGPWGPG